MREPINSIACNTFGFGVAAKIIQDFYNAFRNISLLLIWASLNETLSRIRKHAVTK